MPALRGKDYSERSGHLFERPRGHLRIMFEQSSPSPESGDKGEDSSSALNQLSLVDVRVRGTDGQQPQGSLTRTFLTILTNSGIPKGSVCMQAAPSFNL